MFAGSAWDLYEFLNGSPCTNLDPTGLKCGCNLWETIVCGAAVTAMLGTTFGAITTCGALFVPEPLEPLELIACAVLLPSALLAADKVITKCEKCSSSAVDQARDMKMEIEEIKEKLEELGG